MHLPSIQILSSIWIQEAPYSTSKLVHVSGKKIIYSRVWSGVLQKQDYNINIYICKFKVFLCAGELLRGKSQREVILVLRTRAIIPWRFLTLERLLNWMAKTWTIARYLYQEILIFLAVVFQTACVSFIFQQLCEKC